MPVICIFFKQGSCKFGDNCKNLHPAPAKTTASQPAQNQQAQKQTAQNVQKQPAQKQQAQTETGKGKGKGSAICKFFEQGSCKFGNNCKNLHPAPLQIDKGKLKEVHTAAASAPSGQTRSSGAKAGVSARKGGLGLSAVNESEEESFGALAPLPQKSGTDWMLHIKDSVATKSRPTFSVSTGFTAAASDSAKVLLEYAKMKKKLESLSCWQGNGRKSIELAYNQDKINRGQYERYIQINKDSNQARHE